MIINAQAICTRALRLLGVIGAAETPTPEDLDVAFQSLNELVDTWRLDRTAVHVIDIESFALTSGQPLLHQVACLYGAPFIKGIERVLHKSLGDLLNPAE